MPGLGIDLPINADRRSDVETLELFVSHVMPHFAEQRDFVPSPKRR
jgi:hypothetical protein